MSDSNPFDFDDLAPVRIPVKHGGVRYVLVDASEDAAVKFRNRAAQTARVADGKIVGVNAVAELQSYLLSMTLVMTDAEGNLRTRPDGGHLCIPQEVLMKWPSRIVRPLFDKCKEISRLGELESPEAVRSQVRNLLRVLESMGEAWEGPLGNGRIPSDSGATTSPSPDGSAGNSTN